MCDKSGNFNFIDAPVLSAGLDERTCAWGLLIQLKKSGLATSIQTLFADAGFGAQEFESAVQQFCGHKLEIVRQLDSLCIAHLNRSNVPHLNET